MGWSRQREGTAWNRPTNSISPPTSVPLRRRCLCRRDRLAASQHGRRRVRRVQDRAGGSSDGPRAGFHRSYPAHGRRDRRPAGLQQADRREVPGTADVDRGLRGIRAGGRLGDPELGEALGRHARCAVELKQTTSNLLLAAPHCCDAARARVGMLRAAPVDVTARSCSTTE